MKFITPKDLDDANIRRKKLASEINRVNQLISTSQTLAERSQRVKQILALRKESGFLKDWVHLETQKQLLATIEKKDIENTKLREELERLRAENEILKKLSK